MKFIVENKELNLIPYKGNSKIWWDGIDDTRLYNFNDLMPPVKTTSLNSSYSATRLSISLKMRGSVDMRDNDT
jgi:hypothetical protein